MWFRELTGFGETTADDVRRQLELEGEWLTSTVNDRRMRAGRLEIPSLGELRARGLPVTGRPTTLRQVVGDAGALHADPDNAGAVFQAASQFNLLEMVSPDVTPEAGIDGYEHDHTQGPTCAIACGAGTIVRQYFVEVDGDVGQTADRQVDGLAAVGEVLFPGGHDAWTMRNGYAMFDLEGLRAVDDRLAEMDDDDVDQVRAALRVGVQYDTEVTVAPGGHIVTQVYCSALPVAYNSLPAGDFERIARLVLEATYEATLRVAALHRGATGDSAVFLTLVGGGVFGNEMSWILDAIERALGVVADVGLDVVVVNYGRPDPAVSAMVERSA